MHSRALGGRTFTRERFILGQGTFPLKYREPVNKGPFYLRAFQPPAREESASVDVILKSAKRGFIVRI
jgi:hypothetical protein